MQAGKVQCSSVRNSWVGAPLEEGSSGFCRHILCRPPAKPPLTLCVTLNFAPSTFFLCKYDTCISQRAGTLIMVRGIIKCGHTWNFTFGSNCSNFQCHFKLCARLIETLHLRQVAEYKGFSKTIDNFGHFLHCASFVGDVTAVLTFHTFLFVIWPSDKLWRQDICTCIIWVTSQTYHWAKATISSIADYFFWP